MNGKTTEQLMAESKAAERAYERALVKSEAARAAYERAEAKSVAARAAYDAALTAAADAAMKAAIEVLEAPASKELAKKLARLGFRPEKGAAV